MASKVAEANELIAKAEKSLKTSLLKRKPDYDSAIEYYGKAALIFRTARDLRQAAQLYTKVAELHFQQGSYFHCAKQYEAASQMYRDLKDFDQMAKLITEAGRLLRQNGTPDSASYVYERAAKSLEDPLPEQAAEFYERSADACEALSGHTATIMLRQIRSAIADRMNQFGFNPNSDFIEEKFHEAATQANNAARLWVRIKRFKDAERLLRLYIDYTMRANTDCVGANMAGLADSNAAPKLCGRAATVMILIKLYLEDEVAANKIFGEALERWRFGEAEEYVPVRRLLSAVEDQDKAACMEAIKAPSFRLLDLDYARLAKEIKFPYPEQTKTVEPDRPSMPAYTPSPNAYPSSYGESNTQSPNRIPNQPPVAGQSNNDNQEEAEEEEDIC